MAFLLDGSVYIMLSDSQLKSLIKSARENAANRKFQQSVELTLVLKDIEVKKGFNLNEVVALPYKSRRAASICIVASGDMGTKAQRAGIDRIIEPAELDRLGTNKREARKIVRSYNFFLSDTALMSTVGRSLGQFLGPKGKMPSPLPYGAPVESIASRLKNSVRVRAKNQLNISAKIGDEDMDDDQLTANASAILATVEKKLPQGEKNVRNAIVKFTMGRPAAIHTAMIKENQKRGGK
ncbi:MAG: 50S ribosomal protein L1 [Nitrososphaeraceae archaeon]|jgi:large subunit ribosomal protein L1